MSPRGAAAHAADRRDRRFRRQARLRLPLSRPRLGGVRNAELSVECTPRPIAPKPVRSVESGRIDRPCRHVRHAPRPPASSPSSCPPSCRAIGIAPEWKDQQRLWGHSFHPMCSYLASFPAALAHAFIARYSRRGDVVLDPFSGRGTTPLQASRRGPDRRRQRPQPVRPSADRREGRAGDAAPRRGPGSPRSASPGRPTRPAWLDARRAGARRSPATRSSRGAGCRSGPDGGAEPVPAEVALAFHPPDARPAPARPDEPRPRRSPTDRFLAAAPHRHPPRQERVATCPRSCRTPSAWPRATSAISPPGPRSARPSATSSTASSASSTGSTARRRRRSHGVALLGDARDVAPRARAALRARGLPDRARLVVTSPPYLRVVKYGYYNWLRTWFLGLRRPRDRRDARRRPSPRAVPRVPARRPRRPARRPDRRRGRRPGHRRRRDRPRAADPRRRRPGRAGLGGRRRAGGLSTRRRRRSTTSPPTAR